LVADLADLHELGLFHDAKWVRLQLVRRDAEFETPFGRRALLYADHTVSGCRVPYIEDYILKHVLPFYGQRACLFIPHAPPSFFFEVNVNACTTIDTCIWLCARNTHGMQQDDADGEEGC